MKGTEINISKLIGLYQSLYAQKWLSKTFDIVVQAKTQTRSSNLFITQIIRSEGLVQLLKPEQSSR